MVNQVSFSKRTMGEADDSKFESTHPDDMATNAKNDDSMRRLISNATTIQFDTRNLEHNLSSFTTAGKGSSSSSSSSAQRRQNRISRSNCQQRNLNTTDAFAFHHDETFSGGKNNLYVSVAAKPLLAGASTAGFRQDIRIPNGTQNSHGRGRLQPPD